MSGPELVEACLEDESSLVIFFRIQLCPSMNDILSTVLDTKYGAKGLIPFFSEKTALSRPLITNSISLYEF